jgi:hypothetical protein
MENQENPVKISMGMNPSDFPLIFGADLHKVEYDLTKLRLIKGRDKNGILDEEGWAAADKVVIEAYKEATPVLQNILNLAPEVVFDFTKDGFQRMIFEEKVDRIEQDGMWHIRSIPLPITYRPSIEGNVKSWREAALDVGNIIDKTILGKIYDDGSPWSTNNEWLIKIYGFTNFPERITMTQDKVDKEDIGVVGGMMKIAREQGAYGPYLLICDGDTSFGFMANCKQYSEGKIKAWARSKNLKDEILLVDLNPATLRLIRGLDPILIQTGDKFIFLTITVPWIRTDYHERSGIVHCSLVD